MLGRYELIRPLARGGMAELFLARRRAPGGVEKRMVIKRIRRERARDARFAGMFVREARLSMSLAHKNIVPVFDFGRAGDELFLVMDYVDGIDLATALALAIEQGTPPAPVLVAFIGLEACQALEYAQQVSGLDGVPQGVIHCDVTPSNVLLSYSGEVKLLDFGIATSETEIGEASRVRGTPPYMAPEQARGEPVSARTDVFALGLVLWEALAGHRAYAAKEPREVLAAARRGEVAPLDPERAPPALRAIVARATRADPAERFPDARAMQLALDEYLVEARAGLERRGPTHQLLASWVRELSPAREAGAVPVADLEGPVATFLDDGEERVTHLFPSLPAGGSTVRSMAATMPEPADLDAGSGQAIEVGVGAAAGGDRESARPSSRPGRRRSRGWFIAAAIIFIAVPGLAFMTRELTSRDAGDAPAERPAAAQTAGRRVKGPPPTAVPPGDAAAPRSETQKGISTGELGAPEPPARPATSATPTGESAETLPSSGAPAAALGGRRSGVGAGRGPDSAQATDATRDAPAAAKSGGNLGARSGGRPGSKPGSKIDARAHGTIRVSSTPWAEVQVVGRPERCRETPCTLVLPAGSYVLALRNPVADMNKNVTVEVRADETVTLRETLTAPR